MKDMFERLASEASRLVAHRKRKTLTSCEIEAAVKLTLVGKLIEYATLEGARALTQCLGKDRRPRKAQF